MEGSERSPRRVQLTVQPEWGGMRVASVLRYKLGLSGTVLRRIKWLPDGILLDGVRVNSDVRVTSGQVVDVRLSDPSPECDIEPVPGPLDVVYLDEDLIVVNKAPGVSVHPGPGHHGDTLGNYLRYYYQTHGISAALHPVHRLDKGTSGLIVTALHPFAQDQLRQQLHSDRFRRTYLAVCQGHLTGQGEVYAPIGRCEDSILKRRVRPDGDDARTRYQVLAQVGSCSLVQLELETGRTHQIRVHMAHLGYPLVGDFLYGAEERERISRPALHSWRLSLRQPVTGEMISLEAPLPGDMLRLLEGEEPGFRFSPEK